LAWPRWGGGGGGEYSNNGTRDFSVCFKGGARSQPTPKKMFKLGQKANLLKQDLKPGSTERSKGSASKGGVAP